MNSVVADDVHSYMTTVYHLLITRRVTKLRSSQTNFLNMTMRMTSQSPDLNPIHHWYVVEWETYMMDLQLLFPSITSYLITGGCIGVAEQSVKDTLDILHYVKAVHKISYFSQMFFAATKIQDLRRLLCALVWIQCSFTLFHLDQSGSPLDLNCLPAAILRKSYMPAADCCNS